VKSCGSDSAPTADATAASSHTSVPAARRGRCEVQTPLPPSRLGETIFKNPGSASSTGGNAPLTSARRAQHNCVAAPAVASAVGAESIRRISPGSSAAAILRSPPLRRLPYVRQRRPFAGGRAIETPFGQYRRTQHNPGRETGIGPWSDDAFDAAVRRGLPRTARGSIPHARSCLHKDVARDVLATRLPQLRWRAGQAHGSSRSHCRFRSISGPAMRVGTLSISARANTSPTRKSPPRGIGELFCPMGQVICGTCQSPEILPGGDKTPIPSGRPPCKMVQRPTSPTTAARARQFGRRRPSPPI